MTPPGVNAGARLRAESQQLAQPETTCWVVRGAASSFSRIHVCGSVKRRTPGLLDR